MSALPGEKPKTAAISYVGDVPSTPAKESWLDHLVGAGEQPGRMSMSSAVLRVIIISNRVGCSTSLGFVPRSTPAGCVDDLPHRSDHQIRLRVLDVVPALGCDDMLGSRCKGRQSVLEFPPHLLLRCHIVRRQVGKPTNPTERGYQRLPPAGVRGRQ
jgi:hypothetical protein